MLRYLPMVAVIGIAVYCFIDVLTTDRRRFRSLPKPAWLVVVLLPVVGAILWFVLGRPKPGPGSGPVRRTRPLAPDDDPSFLRQLDEQAWRAKRDAERAKREGEGGEPKGG